jgi:hypothetical protein
MLLSNGNLWDHNDGYIAITTNGVIKDNGDLVMGAGVALEAKVRYPELPTILGKYVFEYGNQPYICKKFKLISFPTKHHFKNPSDIDLILQSARILTKMLDRIDIQKVYMPKPGCGNGGLQWIYVKPLLEKILDDRFTIIE